jgi:hypothetical protein
MENQALLTLQDSYLVTFPILLEGVRCYSDVFLSPDTLSTNIRNAGLGVLIVNTNFQPAGADNICQGDSECCNLSTYD